MTKWNTLKYVCIFKQEAPLALRGQRGRCQNIKGELQIFGSFASPRPSPLIALVMVFIVGFGQPQLHANLKLLASDVAQIFKKKQNFGELL